MECDYILLVVESHSGFYRKCCLRATRFGVKMDNWCCYIIFVCFSFSLLQFEFMAHVLWVPWHQDHDALLIKFSIIFLSLSFSFILSLYLLFLFLSSHSSSLIPYWHINFNMCTQTPNSYKEMRCILNTLPSCLCEFHVFHLHLSDAMKFMSQSESVRYAMRHSYLVGHRANKCKLCMMRRTNCNS